ncbi:putative RNA polymerase, sigma-24 subunit, ECF subfamily [Catenulispora acidiphila DSM 44928]|uniref:RNA polymerase sigma factor n=1 Tax=Catenulispora acidiphila (strain DSM 44928 / JCM 14897 / NBRC 102108 / NRRL B-24433 / ID139908) TaxID=479433 RepID=C7QKG0_CATAD|nr:RNA polymerase sigma factor [Catenulispora acidiphila]ACU77059.1 putative RNA polymerase, sigma-24 subunit, ECF subfamily [Catenulispora acidiphila DSM 44928]
MAQTTKTVATAKTAETLETVEAVWRMEAARVVATLARYTGDLGLAEELAQDALVAALEQWPAEGVPARPGAWLTAVGKRRAVDHFRRAETLRRKVGELGRELEAGGAPAETDPALDAVDEALSDTAVDDDLLRLVFTACHPVLSAEARVALTLRVLGGLTTAEIARAFLVPEATAAQRIVRAKRALADAGVPFEVADGPERRRRLASVLEVVYLIFNEGYSATAGDDWLRADLCEEALRLGRVLTALMPAESEVHALLALMEIQDSRRHARTGPDGEPVLLLDQDRAKWDRSQIERGLAALVRADQAFAAELEAAAAAAAAATQSSDTPQPGTYHLQAALAACHARARTADDTDWRLIADLYDRLVRQTRSPVVELNRAVAVGMAEGPAAGLAITDALTGLRAMQGYHLLPSVRGDLLVRLGRPAEARAEFERAAGLTANTRERALLLARAAACEADVSEA